MSYTRYLLLMILGLTLCFPPTIFALLLLSGLLNYLFFSNSILFGGLLVIYSIYKMAKIYSARKDWDD